MGHARSPLRTGAGLGRRAARLASAVALVGVIAMAAAGLSACGRASAAPPLHLSTAYVAIPKTPGTTVAYVVIRNNGGADRLISARTSVGGHVVFRVPDKPGATAMRTVPSIPVPAEATVQMDPGGYHLLIRGAGPMPGGKDITLTLVFAHAGPISVVAQVTDPQNGGGSYFLN